MKYCWLCPRPLEGENVTGEHVIPSAIGGHKEVFNFICRKCNSEHGIKWEAEVARQFLWFSSTAAVKRGRGGKHPDLKVQTANGEKLRLRSDTMLVPDAPSYDVNELDDKIEITIRANDHKTVRNLVNKIAREYPEFEVQNALREVSMVNSYLDSPLALSFRYGGPEAGRSMVKSCLSLLPDAGIEPDACGRALAYLKDSSPDAPRPFWIFFDADLVANRPQDHLFHCVSVVGQPEQRRLLGYVEFFNFARILVHIGDGYEGEAFQATYAIDPVDAQVLDLSVDFDLVPKCLEDIKMPAHPPQMYLDAFEAALRIVGIINGDRVRALAVSRAAADALKSVGLDPATEEVPAELKEEWLKHFLNHLRPYLRSQLRRAMK
ncbi:HNH endonuclease [Dickeya zeae]|uniref:Integrase n=1 Tax=Dickeya chrysanthemi (strain Ech1591) TaxID=561229 RepID=C6CI95_DICC1|nr:MULTISPECIES: HNH endonuclease [Dickeya]ACT05341.1 integrase [Dickeya chrysanthemi Ech1591]AUQ24265.1 HNH endonuclease [Dickeya zeae]UJR57375.1 HNH endonuclease [Dickeya zeae]UUE10736.1 HNH endonuclease [Dickeya zeae]